MALPVFCPSCLNLVIFSLQRQEWTSHSRSGSSVVSDTIGLKNTSFGLFSRLLASPCHCIQQTVQEALTSEEVGFRWRRGCLVQGTPDSHLRMGTAFLQRRNSPWQELVVPEMPLKGDFSAVKHERSSQYGLQSCSPPCPAPEMPMLQDGPGILPPLQGRGAVPEKRQGSPATLTCPEVHCLAVQI